MVTGVAAIVGYRSNRLGELLVVGDHSASIAQSAQILGRVEMIFFVLVVPFKNICFFCYLPYLTLGGELVIFLQMT